MKRSWLVWLSLLACWMLTGLAGVASAAPGDVDRSFGREGVVTLDSTSFQYATPDDVAVGPNGGIYTLRTVQRCPGYISCVIERRVDRLRPGGDPEGGSWSDGVLLPIGGDLYQEDASIAVDSEERAVIAAATRDGRLALARLNPDGSPDGGFGSAGIAEFDLGVPVDRASVAIAVDGRIVVAAEPLSGYGGDAVIVTRFTTDGVADPTFNGGAPFVTTLGSGFGGLGVTRAGGTVLAGPRCCGAVGNAIHVTALDQVGGLDPHFGRDGQLFVDDVTAGVGVGAVAVLPNGAIYVVGSGSRSGDAFAMRLRPNGRPDRGFGHRGFAYIRHSHLEVADAMVDRAGRLLVVGISSVESRRDSRFGFSRLTLLRRLSNGQPDRTFAGGSLVRIAALGPSKVVGAGLQAGSKAIALVQSGSCIRTCSSPGSVLLRFIGGTSNARCLGHRATIVGIRHGEKLTGTPHRDVIAALAGNDLVRGRGGDDLICGGRGSDRLLGGPGRDRFSGGPGRNRITQ